jgi:hypothetical protein
LLCGNGMASTEEPRQESQRICFIGRRKKFEFVREYNRCHGMSITKRAENTRTSPHAQSSEQPSLATERPLRLRLSGPMQKRACPHMPIRLGGRHG